MSIGETKEDTRLPVTILSGFLGSGKTTLLEWILRSKDHGMRCAVIVNDIGALNIDAALLKKHNVTQTEEKIVQMENGCICCTLRGDLLEEVASLASSKAFDYLIIESTGVSEPQQVAESFAPEFADMHIAAAEELRAQAEMGATVSNVNGKTSKVPLTADPEGTERLAKILAAGGLPNVARLDTCVTVVDACSVLANFNTADFLSDRETQPVDEQDERNISDLMVDQVEFADVIIINKRDLVDATTLAKIKSLIRKLNSDAEILTSVRSRVDLTKILNTRRFSFEKSVMSAGWLKSLREEVQPETEEYGIGSFVYRARRPFSPLRLWEAISTRLIVIQESYEGMLDATEDNEDSEMEDDDEGNDMSEDGKDEPQLDPVGRLKAKQADPTFGPLLRSKGFIWLASRPHLSGEWSQAGVMLTISGGSGWLCETDQAEWPNDDDIRSHIERDFEGEWGDRRQEMVFIGEKMDKTKALLTQEFDKCLLNDEEWEDWQNIMRRKLPIDKTMAALCERFDDGFEDWINVTDAEHDHEHPHA